MKGKILLGLALTSMISTSTFALEIKNGKLLKHKEWTTGNLAMTAAKKATPTDILKFKESLKLKGISLSDHITMAYSATNIAEGMAGERTEVNGIQYTFIINDSEGTQIYAINNSICAQTSEKTTECMYYQDEIQLDAQGMATDLQFASIQPFFANAGTYSSYTQTVVSILDERYNNFVPESIAASEGRTIITANNTKSKT